MKDLNYETYGLGWGRSNDQSLEGVIYHSNVKKKKIQTIL